MPRYAVEVTGRSGCGCHAEITFELNEGEAPGPRDVAAIMFTALDPDETDLLDFLSNPKHAHGGFEKITVTAMLKVR